MTINEHVKFALGAKPIENGFGFIDNDGDKYFIIKSVKDLAIIKNQNSDKYFGYYRIHILSDKELEYGYLPEVIVIDREEDIIFNNDNIIIMMVMS